VSDPSGRDKGTPVFLIKQGFEPPDFIGYFGVWDRDLWSVNVISLSLSLISGIELS